jgi:hypothetical protein
VRAQWWHRTRTCWTLGSGRPCCFIYVRVCVRTIPYILSLLVHGAELQTGVHFRYAHVGLFCTHNAPIFRETAHPASFPAVTPRSQRPAAVPSPAPPSSRASVDCLNSKVEPVHLSICHAGICAAPPPQHPRLPFCSVLTLRKQWRAWAVRRRCDQGNGGRRRCPARQCAAMWWSVLLASKGNTRTSRGSGCCWLM